MAWVIEAGRVVVVVVLCVGGALALVEAAVWLWDRYIEPHQGEAVLAPVAGVLALVSVSSGAVVPVPIDMRLLLARTVGFRARVQVASLAIQHGIQLVRGCNESMSCVWGCGRLQRLQWYGAAPR